MSEVDPTVVFHDAHGRPPEWVIVLVLAVCVVAGAAAFLYGTAGAMNQRAWQAFLVNLVFWTGLSCGAVLFSAVMIITKANWGRSLKRLAESPVLFLPLAFLLFWLLFIGKEHLFPWIHEDLPEKRAWLNVPFFFIREGAALLLLAVAASVMVYLGIRGDQQLLGTKEDAPAPPTEAYRGATQTVWANIYAIFFGVLLTVVAFDLIMSLDPHWYSTLFGAYYFVGSFFTGIAALIILCFFAKRRLGLSPYIKPLHLHNLGKLLLGFCLITADFFYAQFFIIWFGNLPEESHYVLQRVRALPWKPLAWTVLIVCFALPFVVLLSRRIKLKHGFMVALCLLILIGMWLERFLLIAPSIWKGPQMPLGLLELLITVGFFGLIGLCIVFFLTRFPLLPVSDPLFWQGLKRVH